MVVTSLPKELAAIATPPVGEGGDFEEGAVTSSIIEITPELAEFISDRLGFERQRHLDGSHVDALSDVMLNNEWIPQSQITFVTGPDGIPTLIDGQHRLRAAAQAGLTFIWDARTHWSYKGRSEAAALYGHLDTLAKVRNAAVVGQSIGFEILGPNSKMHGLIIGVCRTLLSWDTNYSPPGGLRRPPQRDSIAKAFELEPLFDRVDKDLFIPKASMSQIQRKYRGTGLCACIVATYTADPERAKSFWGGMMNGTDERLAEIGQFVLTGKNSAGRPLGNIRVFLALQWNNWGKGGFKTKHLGVTTPTLLDGTAYRVS